MTLEGLHTVLSQIQQAQWQDQQSFARLVQLWPELVGALVAAQTRPYRLTPDQVLHVSVSTGVWAQNLAFERLRLLAKINGVWTPALRDIHFSTRGWQRNSSPPVPHEAAFERVSKPTAARLLTELTPPKDAQDAFARWSKAVQHQAQNAPRCPRCQCPTPAEELQRWTCCALCFGRLSGAGSGLT